MTFLIFSLVSLNAMMSSACLKCGFCRSYPFHGMNEKTTLDAWRLVLQIAFHFHFSASCHLVEPPDRHRSIETILRNPIHCCQQMTPSA